jgi:type IV secretory pathway VirB10-like protein
MRNSATAERQGPRLGLVGSMLLHAGIIAAMFLTFAHKLDIVDESTPVVPVDLVTVAEKTNIAPMTPPPQAVVPPVPNMVEPTPQEVQAPKFEIAPTESKPVTRPKPQSLVEQFNKMLASTSSQSNAKTGPKAVKGVGAQTAMSADLASILQSEIYRCWNPPVGAPDAGSLIVIYEVYLNRDGTVPVTHEPELRSQPAASNTFRDAANQAAKHAIYLCQPYRLPADRYNEWRDFNFVFDPRKVIGQ